MVESGGLENRCPSNRTVGSNPTASVYWLLATKECYSQLPVPGSRSENPSGFVESR